MISVTVQITQMPSHLRQIGQLSIVRGLRVGGAVDIMRAPGADDVFEYRMVLDGVEYVEPIEHRYGDGVWELIRKCCEAIEVEPNWPRDGYPLGLEQGFVRGTE